jgi:phage terminase small subunit
LSIGSRSPKILALGSKLLYGLEIRNKKGIAHMADDTTNELIRLDDQERLDELAKRDEQALEAEYEGAEPQPDKAVSPKELRFLNHVISGLSRSASATAAGYNFKNPSNGASAIMRRPAVKAMFAELQADAAERARITQDDVIEGMKSAINDAQMTSDPQAQIAGWREIAKMLGYYAPKVRKLEVSKTEERARKELCAMTEKELIDMAGSEDVIEGEFSLVEDK